MQLVEQIHHTLIERRKTLALAESCTGGALSAAFVRIPGASQYLLGSLVVYSNEWKKIFLGVSPQTLEEKGAVSRETVEEMLRGLFRQTAADYGIAISGVLGPTGGTAQTPVGTVFIGVGKRGESSQIEKIQVPSPRGQGIEFTVQKALESLFKLKI